MWCSTSLPATRLPPGQRYISGNVDIKKKKPEQSHPPVAEPCHPKEKDQRDDGKADGFALGAVMAAEWIAGKKGIFSIDEMMQDLL